MINYLNLFLIAVALVSTYSIYVLIKSSRIDPKTFVSDTGDEQHHIYQCTCATNAQKRTCKRMQDREKQDYCNENLNQ